MWANGADLSSLSPGLTAFSTSRSHPAPIRKYIRNGPQNKNPPFCNVIVLPALPVSGMQPLYPAGMLWFIPWQVFTLRGEGKTRMETAVPKLQISEMIKKKKKKLKGKNICYTNGPKT